MSLKNDFLALIDVLWDIEQFNMWNPQVHSSIAYVMEHFYDSENYADTYEHWMLLARKNDYNEFAWEISKATLEAYRTDAKVEKSDVEYMEKAVAAQFKRYSSKQLCVFGLVSEKYIPDWFFGLFHSYLKVEESKRDIAIKTYLIENCDMSNQRAENALKKLSTHIDILLEFYFYVKNKRFKEFNPITVKKISAKQLVNSTYLSPVGAYNYLIYLRESPKEAMEDLKKGLPKKIGF